MKKIIILLLCTGISILTLSQNVVQGEYFIDSDPGFGMGMQVTIDNPDSVVLQNFSAVASALSEGYHKLYGRFKDHLGRWSFTFRRNMEVYKADTNKVLKGEYFFTTDLGFGSCSPVAFAVPAADGSFTINIPGGSIPMGADTLFIRVRDDIESRWSITQILGNISGALPLTLLDFSAVKQNAIAQLTWQTANELNTSHFNVQRSTDGINFVTVEKVNATPGTALQNNYTYADDISGLKNGNVYYRLQMVDNDGRFSYSKVAYITITNDFRISIYPNPAHDYFIIDDYDNSDARSAMVLVRDITGRTLISQKFSNANQQQINITSLSKGMYMISIITAGNIYTQNLVKE